MSVPAMDAPSVAFAHLLDSMVIEEQDDTLGPVGTTRMVMVHNVCGQIVCDVEDSDDLRTLLNTALQHRC